MSSPRLAPLAAAIGIAFAAPAQAINLAPDGSGEVLLFPYYTVRNGFDTILTVTNSSDRTVLAALRLREANNGRTVGELHLILSPHDMWTAGVTSDGGNGAYLRSFDTSCTAPALPAGPSGSKQMALSASGYDGSGPLPYDNGGTSLSRVQEGFVELIEMASSTLSEEALLDARLAVDRFNLGFSTVPESAIAAISGIEYASQHAAGVPRDCGFVVSEFADAANFAESGAGTALASSVFSSFEAPKNVLFGSATLINVGSGHAYDAAPTVVQNFRNTTPIIHRPQAGKPTLASGDAGMAATLFDRDGALVTTPAIANPVDAVSVVLMADSLSNEYASGGIATSGARTDWVLTFPTKHFYTDEAEAGASAPLPPFSQTFAANRKSCDESDMVVFDRNERTFYPSGRGPDGTIFNSGLTDTCASTNVLSWLYPPDNTLPGVLGSTVGLSVDTSTVGSAGWAIMNYSSPRPMTRSPLLGFTGLPAIGFSVIERNNSAQAGNNRNYGSGRPHVVELISP